MPSFLVKKPFFQQHKSGLKDVDYRRIFPNAKTIFEANRMAREIYPKDKEFMAFELL